MKGFTLVSTSPEESLAIGRELGRRLSAGDVVALWGELGAGKTLLAGGIARGLGIPDNVAITSPTFTIINEYEGRLRFYHLDLYRIGDLDELETLPWREALFGEGVAVIEWPERLESFLPEARLDVHIEVTGERRRQFQIQTRNEPLYRRIQDLSPKSR